MGFKKVLLVLQEVFPEVDSRALRAVAIEHQKDPDAAVEAVLNEVIPFLSQRSFMSSSRASSSIDMSAGPSRKVNVAVSDGQSSSFNDVVDDDVTCQEEEEQPASNDVLVGAGLRERVVMETIPENSTQCDDKNVTVDWGTDVLTSSISSTDETGDEASGSLVSDQVTQSDSETLEQGHVNPSQGLDVSLHSEAVLTKSFEKEDNSLSNSLVSEPFDLQMFDMNKVLADPDGASASHETVDAEDDAAFNLVATRSGQICSMDVLEDIIADARNNKKTLLSAVEDVLGLLMEVEAQEEATEKAKEDASNGGLDILKNVEDLKTMLQHAKEANEMHAGEVYGEKAILATEVRELHSRLLCMSEERDNSLKIFDEMRQSLEERLALAEREIMAAELEKHEKEIVARKELKQAEVIMEKVVQESNILKQEAEANANLREFLIDRGRVVDMLQGEISVICKDMRLLKERFDQRLPLSKSLISSQTSCFRASSSLSSSFSKSTSSDQVDPASDLVLNLPEAGGKTDDDNKKFSSDNSRCVEEEKMMVDRDADLDGWEIFEYKSSQFS